jgi:hypothetical protein
MDKSIQGFGQNATSTLGPERYLRELVAGQSFHEFRDDDLIEGSKDATPWVGDYGERKARTTPYREVALADLEGLGGRWAGRVRHRLGGVLPPRMAPLLTWLLAVASDERAAEYLLDQICVTPKHSPLLGAERIARLWRDVDLRLRGLPRGDNRRAAATEAKWLERMLKQLDADVAMPYVAGRDLLIATGDLVAASATNAAAGSYTAHSPGPKYPNVGVVAAVDGDKVIVQAPPFLYRRTKISV